ncbi:NitT/TauT family transport system substrate-binding protein [Cytobacillus eiseniae]|uniref:NitT/TauT family transport system substrate-binding protein n=1 Tax=Cytobacillus eiseniae TaxID=762947 RepID=A0ABS4RF24_9BACI|nr:MqnA/MqnD/SBP family protein [Cytobacillus eiseniae]MBP2241509.1 NitT/TauT family transport system substrate-binding protein [Cytobacillus eiseniae]
MNKVMFRTVVTILIVLLLGACSSNESDKKGDEAKVEEETEEISVTENLAIQAPAGVSIAAPIYKIIEDNHLGDTVEEISFMTWNTPDELRARISSNQVQVSAVPTYVGANLYNKDVDIKLVNTLIWGILYMIGPEGEEVSLKDLKGKTIHVPFKGDMPDLVFKYLLNKNNIQMEELNIEYTSTPQEVVQLLAAGKAEYAILPEHTASLALAKAKKEGKNLQKALSLQDEWAAATGKEARIPQAGIIVSGKLIESNPEAVENLQNQLMESIAYLNESPEEAAKVVAKYQDGLEPAFIQKLIPSLNLKFVTAKEAKEELEFFFSELATISPDIIGGKLPDEGFYYEK